MVVAKLATCSLAQWALDFTGNLKRIRESIVLAKEQGYVRTLHALLDYLALLYSYLMRYMLFLHVEA